MDMLSIVVGVVAVALVAWFLIRESDDKVQSASTGEGKKINEGAPVGKEEAEPVRKPMMAPPPKTSTKKVAEKKPAAKKAAAVKVDYSAMTKAQLLEEAEKAGVSVAKSANKTKIIEALTAKK